VQETFLRAYAAWHTFTPGTECRNWLLAICRNTYFRLGRRDVRFFAADDPSSEALASAMLYHGAMKRGVDASSTELTSRRPSIAPSRRCQTHIVKC